MNYDCTMEAFDLTQITIFLSFTVLLPSTPYASCSVIFEKSALRQPWSYGLGLRAPTETITTQRSTNAACTCAAHSSQNGFESFESLHAPTTHTAIDSAPIRDASGGTEHSWLYVLIQDDNARDTNEARHPYTNHAHSLSQRAELAENIQPTARVPPACTPPQPAGAAQPRGAAPAWSAGLGLHPSAPPLAPPVIAAGPSTLQSLR